MKLLHLAASLAVLLLAPACWAEVSFNGFGQIVAGSALDDDKPMPGLSYDSDVSFEPESLFALQATAPLAQGMDAVTQIVARGRNDYDPVFSWAYVRFLLDEHWSLKAGRQRIALYRYSDHIDVGSAYPFLRPPLSVYDVALSNGDGLSLAGSYGVGAWSFLPQLQYFEIDLTAQADDAQAARARVNFMLGAVLEASYDDWLSLRTAYFRARLTSPLEVAAPLLDGLVDSGEADAAAELDAIDDTARFWSAGFDISRDNVLLGGEYVDHGVRHSYIGSAKGYYLSLGYRWQKLTPIMSWQAQRGGVSNRALRMMNPANPFYPAVQGLIAATQSKDRFLSLGLRYDLRDKVALKFDYTRRSSKIDGEPNARLVSAGLVFSF